MPAEDKFFSRIHFMVEINPPLCRLTDMGSTNGTMVNGVKVDSAELNDGDLIRAGKTVLRVSVTGGGLASLSGTGTLLLPQAAADDPGTLRELQTSRLALPGGGGTTVDHPGGASAGPATGSCRVCEAPLATGKADREAPTSGTS